MESALVPAIDGSEIALDSIRLDTGASIAVGDGERDTLLFVDSGLGTLTLDGGTHALAHGAAALVLAKEDATLEAGDDDLAVVRATVGSGADRHAALGVREIVASLGQASTDDATGARSFEVLFGPHNGSTRATMFVGFIPPGRAPWHYHFYDEIVWVPKGPGRLHVGERVEELGPGSAFRLRPREVHIVENTSPDRDLAVLGVFTPAGSPSAAYVTEDVAAEYRFAR
jgi:quercetin dioxygenase-like cupin family protein